MKEARERINQVAKVEAESLFRDCCGSAEWARQMANSRPFTSDSELMETAAAIWNDLGTADWLEAFSAHPMIGDSNAPPAQPARSAEWSTGEQAGMESAAGSLKQELANANREYNERFGFIFIVCATGKAAGEMLALCRARLGNERETEIAIAAREQQQITEIRLRKFLSL